MGFGACIERGNRLIGAGIRPVGSARPHILQPLRQVPVHEALGREGDFSVFHARFQKVANLDMRLFADVLRNYNLKFVFYGDVVLEFACSLV
jgi:hypothetical protein